MGANPSGEEGGAPIENQRTLQIHLVLEVTIPEGTPLFQALTLAFWRFQGLAVTTLFTAVLQAIESRTRTELETRFPGRFRNKGTQPRQWQLPFGEVHFTLVKLWDPGARRTVYPLKEAMELPKHVRWCEETLVPGYRLAVLQSFRQSQRAVQGLAPDGRAPSHHTVHRRFQGFAETLDPVPDYTHRPGPKPAAYQQADGTKLKLQAQGHPAGSADLRLVVGSRTPHGPLEVLDYSVGDSWDASRSGSAAASRSRPRSWSAMARRGSPRPWPGRRPCTNAAWSTGAGTSPSPSTRTATSRRTGAASSGPSRGSPAFSSARRSWPGWIRRTPPPSGSCWRPRSRPSSP